MVVDAVLALNDKEGSSLNAIRKYCIATYDIKNQHKASFNNLTLKAVNQAVAADILEKVKHSFRLSLHEKERRRLAEKQAEAAEKRALHAALYGVAPSKSEQGSMFGGSRKFTPFVIDSESLHQLATSHNKNLRKELLDFRDKRDKFLVKRLDMLKPFLPSKNNYFKRLLRDRENRRLVALANRQQYMREAAAALQAGIGYQIPPKHPDESIEELDASMRKYIEEPDEMEGEQVAVKQEGVVDSSNATAEENQEEDKQEEPSSSTMDIDDTFTAPSVSNMNVAANEKSAIDTVEEDTNTGGSTAYDTMEGVPIIEKPEMLTATLHEHQYAGISWMVHMFKNGMPMILGDQMGLGKTIQTIGFMAYLHEKMKKKGPHLVVVPLSVLSNWLSEIEKFCPSFRTVRFHGPKSERERIKLEEMKDLKEFDIVVTTYEILVSEINFFRRKYVWTTVVIDEGHRLKNEKSQFSEKMRCVPCVCKVILTGTPLQNNLRELWSMLYYLAPEIFVSSEKFEDGFDLLRGKIDSNILRQARRMLSVFMLRRLKENVSIKLPSRKEVTLLVNLTPQQVDLYKQLLCGLDASTIDTVMREASTFDAAQQSQSGMSRSASTSNTVALSGTKNGSTDALTTLVKSSSMTNVNPNTTNDSEWRKLMNILLQLRKICNHTYLLPNIAPDPYDVTEELVHGSGKLLMLDRMLPALRADGHRVLLFSQFTSMLDILEDYCELRDYPFVRLDGDTNRVKRRLDCRRYNAPNSPLFIFLISTRAGGLGLNLASADTVILYDSDWNPQVDLQAMERAHRIGQTKPVRVFRLVCRGSVEERMVSRAEKKLFLNAMVAERDMDNDDTGSNMAGESDAANDIMQALGVGGSTLSKGELASLIRFGANAVFDSSGGNSNLNDNLSDEDLYKLLERNGRDMEEISVTLAQSVSAANAAAEESHHRQHAESSYSDEARNADAFEAAQLALKERMQTLKEVDLRQLGDMIYTKKKTSTKQSSIDTSLILTDSGPRERKQRIIMVDGKGTGYGGAVPVLNENMGVEEEPSTEDVAGSYGKLRGRSWWHRTFCTLCAKDCVQEEAMHNVAYNKCAHCPFVFHQRCGEEFGLVYKGSGLLICPHHRCVDCGRSTASAGGLLFRCTGCLTSYCEDCLPQDEIESMGRCRALENQCGYHSKQAYYIKCPYCCKVEGVRAQGVLGDRDVREAQEKEAKMTQQAQLDASKEQDGGEGGDNTELSTSVVGNAVDGTEGDEEAEEESAPWDTQLMRIKWEEYIPPPPPPPKEKKSKKKSKAKGKSKSKAKSSVDDNSEDVSNLKTPKKGGNAGNKSVKNTPLTGQKRGRNGSAKKQEIVEEEDEEEEDEEEEEEEDEEEELPPKKRFHAEYDEPHVPDVCSSVEAIQLFLQHPVLTLLLSQLQSIVNDCTVPAKMAGNNSLMCTKEDLTEAAIPFVAKAEAGRYRSAQQLMRDLWYLVEGKLQPALQKSLSMYTVQKVSSQNRERSEDETQKNKEQVKFWKEREQYLLGCWKAFLDDDLEECVRL
jgi:SWI/SNF-related matrix-associated actin-dependent regulator of chromatin subfamily A member 5